MNHYLVFKDGNLKISKWLKKGYQHVLIVAEDGYNWLAIEPTQQKLEWVILPLLAEQDPFAIYWPTATVVSIKDSRMSDRTWMCKIGVMSCVLFVKYYLGLFTYRPILTPWQLYQFLLKKGYGERRDGI